MFGVMLIMKQLTVTGIGRRLEVCRVVTIAAAAAALAIVVVWYRRHCLFAQRLLRVLKVLRFDHVRAKKKKRGKRRRRKRRRRGRRKEGGDVVQEMLWVC